MLTFSLSSSESLLYGDEQVIPIENYSFDCLWSLEDKTASVLFDSCLQGCETSEHQLDNRFNNDIKSCVNAAQEISEAQEFN